MLKDIELSGTPCEEAVLNQVSVAGEIIGAELLPPSQGEDVLNAPLDSVRTAYKERFRIFLSMLGLVRRHQKDGGLQQEELPEFVADSRKSLEALNRLDAYIEQHMDDPEMRTLYEHQMFVFEDLRKFLEKGQKAGYIKLPTGYGKTVIFTEFIEALGLRTLIVVPTQVLVDQTEEKIDMFAEDLDTGKIYTHAKEHGEDVTITTYSSLVSSLKSGRIKPEDFDCLILDEAHRSLTKRRMDAVERFAHAIKIGFSATPEFNELKKVENLLPTEIHAKLLREAIEEGCLSAVRVVLAKIDMDLSNVSIAGGEYNQKELEKVVNVASSNKAAVQLYLKAFTGKKAVAYCVGVNHARSLAREFNNAGVKAAYIAGSMSKEEKALIYARYKSGELKVLCNAKLLTEGFDDPEVEVCLNLAPTHSRVVAEQRGGRALRKNANKPNKLAVVVDFISNNHPEDESVLFSNVLFSEIIEGAAVYPQNENGSGPAFPPLEIPEIEGLEIVVDEQEIAKISNAHAIARDGDKDIFRKTMEEIKQLVAQGWKSYRDLAAELGVPNVSVRRKVNQLILEKPGLVKRFESNIIYIHPDLIPEIVEYFETTGWTAITNIMSQFSVPNCERDSFIKWLYELDGNSGKNIKLIKYGSREKTGVNPGFVEYALNKYIEENSEKFVTLASVAEEFGLSCDELLAMLTKELNHVRSVNLIIGAEHIYLLKVNVIRVKKIPLEDMGYVQAKLLIREFGVRWEQLFQLIEKYKSDMPGSSVCIKEEGFDKPQYVYLSPEYRKLMQEKVLEIKGAGFAVPAGFVDVKQQIKNLELPIEFEDAVKKLKELHDGSDDPITVFRRVDLGVRHCCLTDLWRIFIKQYYRAEMWKGYRRVGNVHSTYDKLVEQDLIQVAREYNVSAGFLGYFCKKKLQNGQEKDIVEEVLSLIEECKNWPSLSDVAAENGIYYDISFYFDVFRIAGIDGYSDIGYKDEHEAEYGFEEYKCCVNPEKQNLVKAYIDDLKETYITISQLAEDVGLSKSETDKLLTYLNSQGRLPSAPVDFVDYRVHVSVKRRILKMFPPENWLLVSTVKPLSGLDNDDFKDKLNKLRNGSGEGALVGEYWDKEVERVREYCSPEAVALLAPEDAVTEVPEGYELVEVVMERFGLEREVLIKLLSNNMINPEKFRDEDGVIRKYLSIEAVAAVDAKRPCPENWMSYADVRNDYGGRAIVIAKRLLGKNPTLGREFFYRHTGEMRMGLHPDLIDLLEEQL